MGAVDQRGPQGRPLGYLASWLLAASEVASEAEHKLLGKDLSKKSKTELRAIDTHVRRLNRRTRKRKSRKAGRRYLEAEFGTMLQPLFENERPRRGMEKSEPKECP